MQVLCNPKKERGGVKINNKGNEMKETSKVTKQEKEKPYVTSFRVAPENSSLIANAKALGFNAGEFINEAIMMHGPHLLKKLKTQSKRRIEMVEFIEARNSVVSKEIEKMKAAK